MPGIFDFTDKEESYVWIGLVGFGATTVIIVPLYLKWIYDYLRLKKLEAVRKRNFGAQLTVLLAGMLWSLIGLYMHSAHLIFQTDFVSDSYVKSTFIHTHTYIQMYTQMKSKRKGSKFCHETHKKVHTNKRKTCLLICKGNINGYKTKKQ